MLFPRTPPNVSVCATKAFDKLSQLVIKQKINSYMFKVAKCTTYFNKALTKVYCWLNFYEGAGRI